jgi:alpha-glucosidase
MTVHDSGDSSYQYVRPDNFNPNSLGWVTIGAITSCLYDKADNIFTLTGTGTPDSAGTAPPPSPPVLKIYLLGPYAFRVRFNTANEYGMDGSFAVVNKNLGAFTPNVLQNDNTKLSVDLGGIRLDVIFARFSVQVYMGGELISTDSDKGLIYSCVAGKTGLAVANFKNLPANAYYFGAGEKGGSDLILNDATLTFFNYDNYKYGGQPYRSFGDHSVVPGGTDAGPLNWIEPLYNSIPFLIEDNPNPLDGNGDPTKKPYSYGILFDNESQSYFNFGASSSYAGNMYGKYYFGALYGEIDYYFMAGVDTPAVLKQYMTLVGAPALPPMWALGYHQGAYGYYDQGKVLDAIKAYRANNIPIDGVHIDVDFQDNYRTFTASNMKFPNGGADCFAALAKLGVKASTNITGIVTSQPLDEANQKSTYSVLEDGLAKGYFVMNVRAEDKPAPANPVPFVTNESYGSNLGSNPFPSPPFPQGQFPTPLGTYGHYADLGQEAVREWWGTLYKPLLDAGLEMVWQDMTDPATAPSKTVADGTPNGTPEPNGDSAPWKTLPLNIMMFDYTQMNKVPAAVIHNVFALNLISATHSGLVKLRKEANVDKRPFIIARGGFTGVHRYAASWTGDSASDWNFMSILIPEILNFGLSGQPMAGADVGGFAVSSTDQNHPEDPANGTPKLSNIFAGQVFDGITDPELLTRWTTTSAFIGWFRNHYDGYNKQYQEPYAYGDPYMSACRKYIEIRYKLLQLFYDSLYAMRLTGVPICRAMFLNDRSDPNVYKSKVLNSQFMVGDNLLVAPVVTRAALGSGGATTRDVYLPAGSSWYAYTDAQAPIFGPSPGGGKPIPWYVALDLVPIYVRAGGILPRRELEQWVGQLAENPLTFEVYPGPDSSHTLYLDDKVGMGAINGDAYRTTVIAQSQTLGPAAGQRTQSVSVTRTSDKFTPVELFYYVSLLGSTLPNSVTVNGAPLKLIDLGSDSASAAGLADPKVNYNAYYFSVSLQTIFIKVFDTLPAATIVATM